MKNRLSLGVYALIVVLLFSCGTKEERVLFSTEELRTAIENSARYLVRNTREDGMFNYRVNMDPRISGTRKYNILRHAGTIYAMARYYQLHPDEQVRSAMERAGRYLQERAIGPLPGKEDLLAIWSKPEVNGGGSPLQAKLGGTGLGLVALTGLEKVTPGFTPLDDLRKLGRFIVYMQKEDGSFYSKYVPSRGGRNDDWESLYYPGEATLGLLMLYEMDPSDLWITSAARALGYLAHGRRGESDIPVDHWALLATERMVPLMDEGDLPVTREQLIYHARQICEVILEGQVADTTRPMYRGGFDKDGRTTPTATRLEGLLATLALLHKDRAMRKRIESAVHSGVAFLLRAQISGGEFAGGMPRAIGKLPENKAVMRSFNRRAAEVRIDYVQHALCAMMQYLLLVK